MKKVADGADQNKPCGNRWHFSKKDEDARLKYVLGNNSGDRSVEGNGKNPLKGDENGRMWGYYQSVAVLEPNKDKNNKLFEVSNLDRSRRRSF